MNTLTEPKTNEREQIELFPCPFCGEQPVLKIAGRTNYWWVGCEIHLDPVAKGCGVSHSSYDRQEAADKWNNQSVVKRLFEAEKERNEFKRDSMLQIGIGNQRINQIEQLKKELALAKIPTTVDAVEREEWRQEKAKLNQYIVNAQVAEDKAVKGWEDCSAENEALIAELRMHAEANKSGSVICRAFRYSMDRAVPFPSVEKLDEAIRQQEAAICQPFTERTMR